MNSTESQFAVSSESQLAIRETRDWLEKAVIGLNLCPFAKSVHVKGQIHYTVSQARSDAELLQDLEFELKGLLALTSVARDTTLLIAPYCFAEFLEFNDFMTRVDRLLEKMGLDGVLQVANFHPDFQFAGTEANDITNSTNRAPYPTLHLIREESIDRAVQSFPDASAIFEVNMQTLERLGAEGWNALGVGRGKIAR